MGLVNNLLIGEKTRADNIHFLHENGICPDQSVELKKFSKINRTL